MPRRFIVAGLVLIAGAAAVWWFVRDDQAAAPPGGSTAAQPAVNVLDFGARPDGQGDSSRAFSRALDAASHRAAGSAGPSGRPQGVVEVPAGTYRVQNVVFPANVRMEVDAAAVIEVVKGGDGPAFEWQDGVTNVSLVGVGSSSAGKPDAAAGWSVDGSFTFDLDPAETGTGADARGLSVLWATDFLVRNVVIRQGSSCTSCGTDFPNSNSAGITLRSQPGSSEARPLIPRRGTFENVYTVGAPPGYGPAQFGSGVGLRIDGMYSEGGTALRLETDAQKGRYSILDRLSARHIECHGGNAAVSLSPHDQVNGQVRIHSVTSVGCAYGVKVRDGCRGGCGGSFEAASRIADVHVTGGSDAQLMTRRGWRVGDSVLGVLDDAQRYTVQVRGVSCTDVTCRLPTSPGG
jgi:hypothetical protein